ncbi:vWA domain-containing protein [Actinoplanes couchii]|uniref:VWFA domain-containing protein n=1 Tax=Actinoplanes couchii TaxID=403638 RepID=A0ABQ3XKD1_9ACTN|nr:VWA domain-containing protein [Actinoplanes couchii]MDR6320560.1 uncharacterized protein YegL [Actinoplanes couchii]GID58962.1 hypothetical protein Aco03nite_073660 [Actinoplanes couchii]
MSEQATEGQIVMPFYIVCDVSGSMCGDMAQLNAGVQALRDEIMKDPVADDLAMLSIIAFDSTARTVVPLDTPSEMAMQPLQCGGATNYTSAFQEFHRAFTADRARLKAEGKRVFRPCIFFLTDGDPTSTDHGQVFQQLLAYDPVTKQGNKAYPYVTPFGFRTASEASMKALAYPTFGEKKGRYFRAKDGTSIGSLLKEMAGMIATSVLGSTMSATTNTLQYTPPAVNASPVMEGSILD